MNLSKLLTLEKGDVVLTTRKFAHKDLNYKKSSLTWWGRNVSSLYNIHARDEHKEYPNRCYWGGDILFISTGNSYVLNGKRKNKLSILGYGTMFVDSTWSENYNRPQLIKEPRTFDYNNKLLRTILLLKLEDSIKIIKYDKLNSYKKEDIEKEIKIKRIEYALSRSGEGSIIHNNARILDLSKKDKLMVIFKMYDLKTGERINEKLITSEDILINKFYVIRNKMGKSVKIEITGDPFDENFLNQN